MGSHILLKEGDYLMVLCGSSPLIFHFSLPLVQRRFLEVHWILVLVEQMGAKGAVGILTSMASEGMLGKILANI